MLRSMSSRELAQWAAYEKVSGPLGPQYSETTLASLYDKGQVTNYLLGAIYASWVETDNPISKPESIKRPTQVFADTPEEEAEKTAPKQEPQEKPLPPGYVPWQALAAQIELDQGKK
jgi:hypothetical protein